MEIRLADSGNVELKELKSKCKQYFSHYSLFITLGTIWIVATIAGHLSHHLSIFLFICCFSLIKPILRGMSFILKTNKLKDNNILKLSTQLLALGIIFGLSAVFFPFVNNINHFFPAFGLVTALIFLGIYVACRLKIYLFATTFFLTEGLWLGYYYPENFIYPGYIIGYSMIGIGISYLFAGRYTKFKLSRLKTLHKQKRNAKAVDNSIKSVNKSSVSEKI